MIRTVREKLGFQTNSLVPGKWAGQEDCWRRQKINRFAKTTDMLMKIVITSIVAFALSYILNGITIDSFWTAILLAVILAILNAIVKPLLILITLPITIITLGLFLFVINALIILLADSLLDGFEVRNFWWAMLFGLLLSVVSSALYSKRKEEKNR